MGRLVLAGALAVCAVGIAHAGPTRKVLVETEPPGATVYLNDVEGGPACQPTPCTIDAPVGVQTIIVRLDKYEPEIKELEVTKGKRPLSQKIKLKGAIATLKVDTPKGATVRVDEEDKGKAPVEIPVSASEGHHVTVTFNGKNVFDDFVDIATGDEYVVKPKSAGSATAAVADNPTVTDDKDDNEGGGGGGGSGGGSGGSSQITDHSATPRAAYVTAAVAFDVGFRHFTYDQATTSNLRPESEGGQVMAGPALELWPGRMLGVGPLRGLSLFARFQFPVAGQTVTEDTSNTMGPALMGTVKTKWSGYEISLRQRWVFGSFGVEASGGFVQDRFTFDASVGQDILLMPDANYQSVRLGGKLVYTAGSAEPYVSAENRIVLSGGPVGERFDTAKTSGLKASAGVVLKFGAISARAEGTLLNYSWDFTYQPTDSSKASGATDRIMLISMLVGYSY